MLVDKLQNIKDRYLYLADEIVKPEVITNKTEYIKLTKEYANLEPIVAKYDQYMSVKKNLDECLELQKTEQGEMLELVEADIADSKHKLAAIEEEIKIMLLPKDENDEKNVIMEIRGGAGGEEASLFGGVLLRMYSMYAGRQGWKVEIMDMNDTELGGVKECSVRIVGKGAYRRMKFESGVHRVQRVPETEASGRIHTSTATVAVLPEQEEVDIEILDKDLKIDTYRSGGAGGQHVNTTDSAVRITHLPTGIIVACQNERSQIQNREKAMQMLKSKLYDYYKIQADEEYAKNRRNQVGTGDRSERIRTYNYPQGRLTDHRINYTVYNLEAFLNGNLDDLIDNLLIAEQKQKLENHEV